MDKPLFKAQTIPQFKIHQWLKENGLAAEAVAKVDFPNINAVKITDRMGDSMILTWKGGEVKEEYHIKEEEQE